MSKSVFIYDSTKKNADLYYATRFVAGDAFIFFGHRGRKYLVMSDLEIGRAKKEASVHEVLSLGRYTKIAEGKSKNSKFIDVLHEIFADFGIRHLVVPRDMSFALVDALRKKGYKIEAGPTPFFPERYVKNSDEKKYIIQSQRAVFAAIGLARDTIGASKIRGNRLIYKGRSLTSEMLRGIIDIFLLERGFAAEDTIVSCGISSTDPHDVGHGPLAPHTSIVVDVFPKSARTRYYGDATRTFCRGRAPDALRKMYATVKRGQEMGLSMVRAGVIGNRIHRAITDFFEGEGYPTCERGGRMVGFFHGTGHSIGLDVHEEPARINRTEYKLKAGNVFSVEPGLYYPEIGGVRIEDLVFVTKTGCEILAGFPKKLEII